MVTSATVSTLLWQQSSVGESEGMQGSEVLIAGQLFSTNHVLMGATPTKIVFNLKAIESPSGNAELILINSANVEKATFGTIDTSTLTSSFVSHEFENLTNIATIQNGDRLAWHYTGGAYFYFENCGTCSESYTNESYYISSWTNRTIVATMEVWGY